MVEDAADPVPQTAWRILLGRGAPEKSVVFEFLAERQRFRRREDLPDRYRQKYAVSRFLSGIRM
ncbi:hypothetical protein AB0A69_28210 [Streptomyces sp. NPDC045431]|uniref:hypothetical protein n=1 Tax=Streptomyces sp. NPDC045431 TaxID=3155613 RepID=UPI003400493F